MLRRNKFVFEVIGFLLLSFLVVITCTNANIAQGGKQLAPQLPFGTYITQVTKGDIETTLRKTLYPSGVDFQGIWAVKFENDSLLATTLNNRVLVESFYSLTPDKLILYGGNWHDPYFDIGDMGRRPYQQPGVYSWTFDGDILTLHAISEPSLARKLVMQSHSLLTLSHFQKSACIDCF